MQICNFVGDQINHVYVQYIIDPEYDQEQKSVRSQY